MERPHAVRAGTAGSEILLLAPGSIFQVLSFQPLFSFLILRNQDSLLFSDFALLLTLPKMSFTDVLTSVLFPCPLSLEDQRTVFATYQ